MNADRTPIIVGVAQIGEKPRGDDPGRDPAALVTAVLRAADADGGGSWLQRLDRLSLVRQISFPDIQDMPRRVCEGLGIAPAIAEETALPCGTSPIQLLAEAANLVASGAEEVIAIAGGEALRSAARRPGGADAFAASVLRDAAPSPLQRKYGLVTPTEIYPLYENALRARRKQSLAEGQAESARMWALMAQVAQDNPAAAIRQPVPAAEIAQSSATNRPIAFPYTKLMVANAAVNLAAGFIVTSLAAARARGIAEDRLVHVGASAAAEESGDPLRRPRFDRSLSLEACLTTALERNGMAVADLDLAEFYSCFPCIPKLACDAIGWPLDRPVSAYGGLTFGGAPVGNCMSHAVASMVAALRAGTGNSAGLILANGGFATFNHAMVLGRSPSLAHGLPRSFDIRADVPQQPTAELIDERVQAGRIETYTVVYDRDGRPDYGVIVGRSEEGARFFCHVPGGDRATLDFLTSGAREPVGTPGRAEPDTQQRLRWMHV